MIIKKIFATILLTSLICPLLKGQVNEVFRSVASSTMISIGASDILDTYLTPLDYKGLHLGAINER